MRNKGSIQLGLVLLGVVVAALPEPNVNTTLGPLRGVWLKTKEGAQVAGFLGLPYAEPPVGGLRFENPRLWTKNWTKTLNATKDGSKCMQLDEKGVVGSEDCLYLNVFTPTISKNKTNAVNKTLPVLVFVHGGAMKKGSSNSSLFAPTYLLDHGIVLVTLNYRLNVMGFFSTGNEVTPGNYALKDIATALHWVNKNIGAFGGDPKSVTLAGIGAGAALSQLLASSKKTERLFHKLITMSGSATARWATQSRDNIRNESLRVAQLVGCYNKTNNSKVELWSSGESTNATTSISAQRVTKLFTAVDIDRNVLKCLKKANASEIVKNSVHAVWRGNPEIIFGPTLEAEAEGAILTSLPQLSLKEGLFRDMPWITGIVSDEGLIKSADIFLNSQIKAELIQDYKNLLVPYILEMKNVIKNATLVTQLVENFYFNKSLLTNFDKNITQLVGDAIVTWPSYDILQKQITKMKSNVYFYLFDYEGTFSNTFRWSFPFRFGVAHSDDMNYLFPYLNEMHAKQLHLNNSMTDALMINTMCELWTNFVKTGVPSARLTEAWEPYQKNHRYMQLGNKKMTNRSMQKDFLTARMAFWSKLMANHSLPIDEKSVNDGKHKSKNAATSRSAEKVLCVCVTILLFWWSSLF